MKEIVVPIDIKDSENNALFVGNVTLKIPKRAERSSLQLEAMEMTIDGKTDAAKYVVFSEKILDNHVVAMHVKHVPSDEAINCREDLEYIEAELLVSAICSAVIGGRKLGKPNA